MRQKKKKLLCSLVANPLAFTVPSGSACGRRLSSEDVTELRELRKPIDHMLRPFMRQAMAAKLSANLKATVRGPKLAIGGDTLLECCVALDGPQPKFSGAKLAFVLPIGARAVGGGGDLAATGARMACSCKFG